MIEAALWYAGSLGWPVFPVKQRGKAPLTENGHKDATTDAVKIREWWGQWPNANIGVPAGAGTFCVVDVDVKNGGFETLGALIEENGELPDTVCQNTGGGGKHYLFFPDGRVGNSTGRIGQGIDTRGNGAGYIVVAPSVHESGGVYEWEGDGPDQLKLKEIPEWIVDRLKKHSEAAQQEKVVHAEMRTSGVDVESRAAAYIRKMPVAVQGQGGHDKLLAAASALVNGFGLTDDEAYGILAYEFNPMCVPPWDLNLPSEARDFKRKITEARRTNNRRVGHIRDVEFDGMEVWDDDINAMVKGKEKRSGIDEGLLRPPGFVGELCDFINSNARKKQQILTLGNVLAFCGALLGRKVRDEWDTRTNIYCLGIGETGCGKEHSRRRVKDICVKAGIDDELLGGEDVTSDAAIMTELDKSKVILYQWDEVGHMIASMTGKNAASYRQTIVQLVMRLYSSSNTKFLGKQYAGGERSDIMSPNMCLYGTTVPSKLWSGLSGEEIRDGFLGRMLFFISEDRDPPVDYDGSKSIQVPVELSLRVSNIYNWRPGPGGNLSMYSDSEPFVVRTTPEANDIMIAKDLYFREMRLKIEKTNENLSLLYARCVENMRKVALIVASLDAPSIDNAVIGSRHAQYACDLVDQLTDLFIRKGAGNVADSEIELMTNRIRGMVEEAGSSGLPQRVLSNRIRNPRIRNEALEYMLRDNEIFEARVGGKKMIYAHKYFPMINNKINQKKHIDNDG